MAEPSHYGHHALYAIAPAVGQSGFPGPITETVSTAFQRAASNGADFKGDGVAKPVEWTLAKIKEAGGIGRTSSRFWSQFWSQIHALFGRNHLKFNTTQKT